MDNYQDHAVVAALMREGRPVSPASALAGYIGLSTILLCLAQEPMRQSGADAPGAAALAAVGLFVLFVLLKALADAGVSYLFCRGFFGSRVEFRTAVVVMLYAGLARMSTGIVWTAATGSMAAPSGGAKLVFDLLKGLAVGVAVYIMLEHHGGRAKRVNALKAAALCAATLGAAGWAFGELTSIV